MINEEPLKSVDYALRLKASYSKPNQQAAVRARIGYWLPVCLINLLILGGGALLYFGPTIFHIQNPWNIMEPLTWLIPGMVVTVQSIVNPNLNFPLFADVIFPIYRLLINFITNKWS